MSGLPAARARRPRTPLDSLALAAFVINMVLVALIFAYWALH